MDTLTVVQDEHGRLVRVELNGMVLPTAEITIEQHASPPTLTSIVRLTLAVDAIAFTTGEVDTHIVDADPSHMLLEAPHKESER